MQILRLIYIVFCLSAFAANHCSAGPTSITREEVAAVLEGLPPGYCSLEEILDKCGIPLNGVDLEQVVTDMINNIHRKQHLSSDESSQSFSYLRLLSLIPISLLSVSTQLIDRVPAATTEHVKFLFVLIILTERLESIFEKKALPLLVLPSSSINITLPDNFCRSGDRPTFIDEQIPSFVALEDSGFCVNPHLNDLDLLAESETELETGHETGHETESTSKTFNVIVVELPLPPEQEEIVSPPKSETEQFTVESLHWSEYIIPTRYNLAMGTALATGATPCTGYEIQQWRNPTRIHGQKARHIQNMQTLARWTGCIVVSGFSLLVTDGLWSIWDNPATVERPRTKEDSPPFTKHYRKKTTPEPFQNEFYSPDEFTFNDDELNEQFYALMKLPECRANAAQEYTPTNSVTAKPLKYKRIYLAGGYTGLGCGLEAITVAALTDLAVAILYPSLIVRVITDPALALFYYKECDLRSESTEVLASGETPDTTITTQHDYKTYLSSIFYAVALKSFLCDESTEMGDALSEEYPQSNFIIASCLSIKLYWMLYLGQWLILKAF